MASTDHVPQTATSNLLAFVSALKSPAQAAVNRTASATLSQAMEEGGGDRGFSSFFENLGSFGGIFSYLTSRWAITTIFVAILLNRTQAYASSRIPLRFNGHVRFAVYLPAIVALAYQTVSLLQALRCQTSPHWDELRYSNLEKHFDFDFAGGGGFLYRMSSMALFWQSDADSCAAVSMTVPEGHISELSGSLSLLWPLFVTMCVSQFIETMACALQGRQPQPEAGMTIFEHSLAFAEAEVMITKPFDRRINLKDMVIKVTTTPPGFDIKFSRPILLQLLNVPPEVSLIALISALSHLTSNILAVFGLRNRYRLVNTGVWGMCYMLAFTWTSLRMVFGNGSLSPNDPGLMRFPTVCIVGFIPHILIMLGMWICGFIYAIALILTACALPEEQARDCHGIKDRLYAAYGNLQANVNLRAGPPITVRWEDDFYTTLLKIGFMIMTSASEAVYLKEGSRVQVAQSTWLEDKRADEFTQHRQESKRACLQATPRQLNDDSLRSALVGGEIVEGLGSSHHMTTPQHMQSGYAMERRPQAKKGTDPALAATRDKGVGFMQRHGRWATALIYAQKIFWLWQGLNARFTLMILGAIGVGYRPDWLTDLAGEVKSTQKGEKVEGRRGARDRNVFTFWYLTDDGILKTPEDDNVDVEVETRRRMSRSGELAKYGANADELVDKNLYDWWRVGGWWGEIDGSGCYKPSTPENEDTTSVISMSTNASEDEGEFRTDAWSDVDTDDNRRTPTKSDPFPDRRRHHAPTPDRDILDSKHLARLLDPQTPEAAHEARILARHLRAGPGDRPMTRSRFAREAEMERMKVLTSSKHHQEYFFSHPNLESGSQAEEDALEAFILARRPEFAAQQRAFHSPPTSAQDDWASGAEGLGSSGPSCVVCQSSPRIIMAWPCGCLSVCDDCRVGLATRNFKSCVCCRTDVEGFSRLFVP
ncbi:hypothetical protein K402DRAFT_389721 [Aulographum hederae CBS 113979]|uniref:Ubiquitin-protein ligase-like protein n=1 Tax=Aulographum hederae CBS 113979 TaxID=1176131 RepID=A0A6G1HCS6_9PEZI|nr:hypothetical protein K402DRAFT_389721 [Aulographum hederae CBS 113979]